MPIALVLGSSVTLYAYADSIDEQVAKLGAEGVELYDQKNYPAALEKFQAAVRLRPYPTLTVWVGKTFLAQERLGEAYEAFLAASTVQLAPGAPPPFQEAQKEAAEHVEQLRPRLGSVSIESAALPPREVWINGSRREWRADGVFFVAPGNTSVRVVTADGETSQVVPVEAGSTQHVAIEAKSQVAGEREAEEPADLEPAGATEPAPSARAGGAYLAALVGGSIAFDDTNAGYGFGLGLQGGGILGPGIYIGGALDLFVTSPIAAGVTAEIGYDWAKEKFRIRPKLGLGWVTSGIEECLLSTSSAGLRLLQTTSGGASGGSECAAYDEYRDNSFVVVPGLQAGYRISKVTLFGDVRFPLSVVGASTSGVFMGVGAGFDIGGD